LSWHALVWIGTKSYVTSSVGPWSIHRDTETSSRLVGSLFHDHPAKLPQKSVDIRCPPFPCAAIRFNRDSLPTSFAASSVKGHPNIGVTGKTLFHRLVRRRIPTSNDE